MNGYRVSDVLEGYARPGSHEYRIVAIIGGLVAADPEEPKSKGYIEAPDTKKKKKKGSNHKTTGGLGELEYANTWSSKPNRLSY